MLAKSQNVLPEIADATLCEGAVSTIRPGGLSHLAISRLPCLACHPDRCLHGEGFAMSRPTTSSDPSPACVFYRIQRFSERFWLGGSIIFLAMDPQDPSLTSICKLGRCSTALRRGGMLWNVRNTSPFPECSGTPVPDNLAHIWPSKDSSQGREHFGAHLRPIARLLHRRQPVLHFFGACIGGMYAPTCGIARIGGEPGHRPQRHGFQCMDMRQPASR